MVISIKEDEEEDKNDQKGQDDSQKDNKTKKDTSNLPVIDGEKGSAELPDAKGFVIPSDLYSSVFKSMPICVGENPEFNYGRGKAGMIKNIEKYKNTAALKVNTGTGGVYTMVYYRDGSQSVLERKDINIFNDLNWDL